MKLYPVMMNLDKRLAVIIGGGSVAARKAADLFEAGAVIKVISPDFDPEIMEMSRNYPDRVEIFQRVYKVGDLEGAVLVFSATDDPEVNGHVFREAEERNILINAVDDPPNCSFYVPSFVRKGDLIFSLSTCGASPAMAARLRRMMEAHIPERVDDMLCILRRGRELLKADDTFKDMDTLARGELLKKVVNEDALLESLNCCSSDNDIIQFFSSLKDRGNSVSGN